MARPIPLESHGRLDSVNCVLGEFDSPQNEFLRPKNGSRIEVGLITASVSDNPFEEELVNNLGEPKKDELNFLLLLVGEGKHPPLPPPTPAIISHLLILLLDLIPLKIEREQKKKKKKPKKKKKKKKNQSIPRRNLSS